MAYNLCRNGENCEYVECWYKHPERKSEEASSRRCFRDTNCTNDFCVYEHSIQKKTLKLKKFCINPECVRTLCMYTHKEDSNVLQTMVPMCNRVSCVDRMCGFRHIRPTTRSKISIINARGLACVPLVEPKQFIKPVVGEAKAVISPVLVSRSWVNVAVDDTRVKSNEFQKNARWGDESDEELEDVELSTSALVVELSTSAPPVVELSMSAPLVVELSTSALVVELSTSAPVVVVVVEERQSSARSVQLESITAMLASLRNGYISGVYEDTLQEWSSCVKLLDQLQKALSKN